MRLLRAELLKLRRPLTWGVLAAAAVFCVLLAVGGAHNAVLDAQQAPRQLPTCAQLGVAPGPRCAQVRAIGEARLRAVEEEPRLVAAQLNPVEAGAEAAGLMASLPGALAMALLAGGHAGGEWSGRTMKNLLTQHGTRWQVLTATLVSLWCAGLALMAACWAALAVAGPVLARLDHLPAASVPITHALSLAGSQVARAMLVLAMFSVVGVLASMITRTAIGTTATTAVAIIAMLVVAALPGLGRWSPATWVQGWMGFPVGQASITSLPTNFWSRFIGSAGAAPTHLAGLAGLAAFILVGTAVAMRIFGGADVSG